MNDKEARAWPAYSNPWFNCRVEPWPAQEERMRNGMPCFSFGWFLPTSFVWSLSIANHPAFPAIGWHLHTYIMELPPSVLLLLLISSSRSFDHRSVVESSSGHLLTTILDLSSRYILCIVCLTPILHRQEYKYWKWIGPLSLKWTIILFEPHNHLRKWAGIIIGRQ